MKNFKKRYLILLAGAAWWFYQPIFIVFSLQLLLTILIYWIILDLDKHLNPRMPKNNDLTTYLAARDSFQTGDIIAFEGTDFFSKIIRAVTHSGYSHAGMVLRFEQFETEDRLFILEALTQKGVVLMPLSAKLLTYEGKADWFRLKPKPPFPENYRTALYTFLMRQLGKNYDYKDIETFVMKFLFRFSSLEKVVEDPDRMICSELIAQALQAAGLAAFKNPALLAPADLVKLEIFSAPPTKLL